MNDKAFGIRDGEVAIDLPDKFDASLYFIGPSARRGRGARIARKTRVNPTQFAPFSSMRAGPRRWPALRPAAIWSCFIG
jgi:hypothetical protein